MNESKKKSSKIPEKEVVATIAENKEARPAKIKEKKLTDREIADAIGEAVPKSKKVEVEREVKIPKPRKFKTHSEKKNHKIKSVGKK